MRAFLRKLFSRSRMQGLDHAEMLVYGGTLFRISR